MFAFTTIVPLMILVWTLHRLGALYELQSQVGLGLALAIALLGFYIFRQLMGRMSDLIQALGAVVERSARPVAAPRTPIGAPRPAPGPLPAPAPSVGVVVPAAAAATLAPATPEPSGQQESAGVPATPVPSAPPAPPAPPAPSASPPPSETPAVPGLGPVQEVRDLGRAVALLWQAEAATKTGRRVIVSVMNASRPIPGTLIEVTDDGLVLEVEGSERIAVSYKRISAIDTEEAPGEG